MEFVTLGITCHNAHDTISRAISSALNQEYENFEVLVVDDCSTDGSWKILCEIAKLEPRLKILRHDVNRGYAASLNTIVTNASGLYIAIFDDDDCSVPARISLQMDRVTTYERRTGCSLVFCYSNRAVIKDGENSVDHIAYAIGRIAPEPSGAEVVDYLLGLGGRHGKCWGNFGSCTMLARKTTFEAVGPFDVVFRRCAEWDMAIRGGYIGAAFIAVDQPLITQYKTSSPDKSGNISLKYALLLRVKHKSYFKSPHVYWASRMFAYARFYGNGGLKFKSRVCFYIGLLMAPHLAIKFLRV